MSRRVATVLLWLFVINLGIAFGAGLYEHRIVVPRWVTADDSGSHWNAEQVRRDDTGLRFWAYVSTGPLTLLALANLLAAWKTSGTVRRWWLAAALMVMADRVLTFSYFIPTMVGLMNAADSSASVASATRWAHLNYVRHGLVLGGWLAALKTFSLFGGNRMTMTEWFLAELDSEAAKSRRVLEQVPTGKREWKPHERSMEFGYLSDLVANIPSWVGMAITLDELDVAPKDGSTYRPAPLNTSAELVAALDKAVAQAREALQKTTDAHLETPWRLLAGGQLAFEQPRHQVIRDTFLHSAHHRGQMTVYLRLLGSKVASVYGPTADDRSFG